MSIASRIARKIAKHGEDFVLNSGPTTYKGIFQLLDSGRMRTYLDDTESMAVIKPGLVLITTPDVNISTGNTLSRDSRTYTVRKVAIERLSGVPLVKIAVLS